MRQRQFRQIAPLVQAGRQTRPRPLAAQRLQRDRRGRVAAGFACIEQRAPTVSMPHDAEQTCLGRKHELGQHRCDLCLRYGESMPCGDDYDVIGKRRVCGIADAVWSKRSVG